MTDIKDRKDSRTGRARSLRRDATLEERRVWFRLRQLDVQGHFRRQVPVGPYFTDFAHLGQKLVIEIDGAQHGQASHISHDEKRDQWFAANGFRTLRFWNNEVRDNLDGVIDTVLAAMGHVETEVFPPPQPSPPRSKLEQTAQVCLLAGGGSVICDEANLVNQPSRRKTS